MTSFCAPWSSPPQKNNFRGNARRNARATLHDIRATPPCSADFIGAGIVLNKVTQLFFPVFRAAIFARIRARIARKLLTIIFGSLSDT
jgi:hypothetical protein